MHSGKCVVRWFYCLESKSTYMIIMVRSVIPHGLLIQSRGRVNVRHLRIMQIFHSVPFCNKEYTLTIKSIIRTHKLLTYHCEILFSVNNYIL